MSALATTKRIFYSRVTTCMTQINDTQERSQKAGSQTEREGWQCAMENNHSANTYELGKWGKCANTMEKIDVDSVVRKGGNVCRRQTRIRGKAILHKSDSRNNGSVQGRVCIKR